MTLEALEGRTYGPVTAVVSDESIRAFVAATGDDPDRWHTHAPPAYAAQLLFQVAPLFIFSDEVGDNTRVLVHSDQTYAWHAPMQSGSALTVAARVDRVRVRGEMNFVTFVMTAVDGDKPIVTSTSTFLMGTEPSAPSGDDPGEPAVQSRGGLEDRSPERPIVEPATDLVLGPVVHSASRLDLVKYAAASGDFNPIHFDHEAARTAGLAAIVVHGLYMASWLVQLASTVSTATVPISTMKIRFRAPLYPAQRAVASGVVSSVGDGVASLKLRLVSDEVDLVAGTAEVVVE